MNINLTNTHSSEVQDNFNPVTKVCSKCGAVLPATDKFFCRDKIKKDGLRSECKKCKSKQHSKYYETIKNKRAKQMAVYYETNKDKIKKQREGYNLEYRIKNKEKIKENRREYYYGEKKGALKRKAYYKKNKNIILKKHSIYMRGNHKYKEKAIQEIKKYETVTYNKDGFAVFRCAYCGKEFLPTRMAVKSRLNAINGIINGVSRLYCQTSCKESCPIFHKIKHPGKYRKASPREANPVLRQIVLKRDNYTCQKCGSTEYLHCHHVVPAKQNPMTANDPDACVTLCKSCHKAVHKQSGCKYHELKCT